MPPPNACDIVVYKQGYKRPKILVYNGQYIGRVAGGKISQIQTQTSNKNSNLVNLRTCPPLISSEAQPRGSCPLRG